MEILDVYHYDAEGIYIGKGVLTDSDINPKRPGEYLLPANCTQTPVPKIPENHYALWNGNQWRLFEIPAPRKPAETMAPGFEECVEYERMSDAIGILNSTLLKQTAENASFSDNDLLKIAAAGFFDEWKAGVPYQKGKRLMHNGILYVVVQKDDFISQKHQMPGADGMLAVYRPVEAAATGKFEDPIPFIIGMDVENGKYYSYELQVWLAKADMKPCVWNPGTAGMWHWELVG